MLSLALCDGTSQFSLKVANWFFYMDVTLNGNAYLLCEFQIIIPGCPSLTNKSRKVIFF